MEDKRKLIELFKKESEVRLQVENARMIHEYIKKKYQMIRKEINKLGYETPIQTVIGEVFKELGFPKMKTIYDLEKEIDIKKKEEDDV